MLTAGTGLVRSGGKFCTNVTFAQHSPSVGLTFRKNEFIDGPCWAWATPGGTTQKATTGATTSARTTPKTLENRSLLTPATILGSLLGQAHEIGKNLEARRTGVLACHREPQVLLAGRRPGDVAQVDRDPRAARLEAILNAAQVGVRPGQRLRRCESELCRVV